MSCNSFAAMVTVVTDVENKMVNTQSLTKCRAIHKYSYKDDSDVFLTLAFWGNKASAAEKMLKKGDKIFVRGNLVFREYEGKLYIDLNVDDFSYVNTKDTSNKHANGGPPKKSGKKVEELGVEVEAEIPF